MTCIAALQHGCMTAAGFSSPNVSRSEWAWKGKEGERREGEQFTLPAVTDSFISHCRAPDEQGWCGSANNTVNCVL